jgi:hypothetical protein
MFTPTTHITIGSIEFDFVHEYSVESSWMELTDTARIVLPANLKVSEKNLKSTIKKGDAVTIASGYNGNLHVLFQGYVSAVKPTVPIEIECEDLMWQLKQIKVNAVVKNTTIPDFLRSVIPGIDVNGFDVELPQFVAQDISAAKLLQEIKSDFGLMCFIREGKLQVANQYDKEYARDIVAELGYNVKDDNLEYVDKEDVKLNITAISNMSNGTKHEVVIGDPDGDSRTLNFYDVPQADLQKLAEQEAERLIYTGFRGTLTLFAEPFARHGDIVEIRDPKESDKVGRYWIDKLSYKGGVNGFEQVIELGAQA